MLLPFLSKSSARVGAGNSQDTSLAEKGCIFWLSVCAGSCCAPVARSMCKEAVRPSPAIRIPINPSPAYLKKDIPEPPVHVLPRSSLTPVLLKPTSHFFLLVQPQFRKNDSCSEFVTMTKLKIRFLTKGE